MSDQGFTLFDTPIGTCALAWGAKGIIGISLPSSGEPETRARIRKRHPEAKEQDPPTKIRCAVDDIIALLHGKPLDLADVPLDMNGIADFHRRVYDLARTILPGSPPRSRSIHDRFGTVGELALLALVRYPPSRGHGKTDG